MQKFQDSPVSPTIKGRITVLFQDRVSVRLKVLFWHKTAVVKGFGGWK